MLSRAAREFAAEIRTHDWRDAPFRVDRAGHHFEDDRIGRRAEKPLTDVQADAVRANVMLVTAQVLRYSDPNLDLAEYATACGLPDRMVFNSDGRVSGFLRAGLRWDGVELMAPGERD